MYKNALRPAWVEINLNNLDFNIKNIKAKIGDREMIGVIKADAYGHGSVKVAEVLRANGCKTLMFKYGFAFNESKGIQFDVNVKQNGAVKATKRVTIPAGSVKKGEAYEFSMDANVSGSFTIEIVNDVTYVNNTGKNGCRVCVWDLKWTR